ncbi:hypothetical protein O181_021700 [Austropuccinia psidii MF-1]|uniref:Uncharacterized protein n=1 Tax=Austropuccinia psidii MF-1 TaxID=1389203 RepID=A0A9Q3CF34_9BASI|nr:hypothetical protein [Austropuccinia psidii MF-1]
MRVRLMLSVVDAPSLQLGLPTLLVESDLGRIKLDPSLLRQILEMQIEIPDLDDQLPQPSIAVNPTHHHPSSNPSLSRPFGGQKFHFNLANVSANPVNSSINSTGFTPTFESNFNLLNKKLIHKSNNNLNEFSHQLAPPSTTSSNLSHSIKSLNKQAQQQQPPPPLPPSQNVNHHLNQLNHQIQNNLFNRSNTPSRQRSMTNSKSLNHHHQSNFNYDNLSSNQKGFKDRIHSPIKSNHDPSTLAFSVSSINHSIHHQKSHRSRSDTTTTTTTNSIISTSDNLSPLEVAIYLILDRFFGECETKINQLLNKPIPTATQDDVYIPYLLGPGVDPSFDATFESLAQISKKNSNQVINLVMRWKSKQVDGIHESSIQRAISSHSNSNSTRRVISILSERKGLALVYILCRALIAIVQALTREALSGELGSRLEDIVFNSIKNADPHSTARNPNKQANMNMFAYLLGALSNIRFASVSDRFASEIDLMYRSGLLRDQKDTEARLGYLIRAVQFLKLKVYPIEAFEDAIEFISTFASIFETSKGSFIKTTMAETLGPLLAQVVQSATAEVNHPVWNKAIITIFNKAHSMSDKPSKSRYCICTVPLISATVGAAPQDFLLMKWSETADWCFSKLKDKTTRPVVMLGIVQLVWSYLHRVREGVSALNKRLDPLLKNIFPPDRKIIYPSDVSFDTFISLIHFILYWQLDYGSDFVLKTLLSSSSDSNENHLGLVAQVGPERLIIGLTGSLRALSSFEKGEDPPYPMINENQNALKTASYLPPGYQFAPNTDQNQHFNHGRVLKAEILEKPRIKTFVDAFGSKVIEIAAYCDRTLAGFVITDSKYVNPWNDSLSQRAEAVDGPNIIKRHGPFTVEYPRALQPTFEVLQTCIQAWPRILNSPTSESAALGILFRGLISLDTSVAVESKLCLRRFLEAGKAFLVVQAYTRFLTKPEFFARCKPALQKGLDAEFESLIKFWVEALSAWCDQLRKSSSNEPDSDLTSSPNFGSEASKLICHLEANGLVLLCFSSFYVRRSALDALRITSTARKIIEESGFAPTPNSQTFKSHPSFTNLLEEAETYLFDTFNLDELTSTEQNRLMKWKKHRKLGSGKGITRLLESDNSADNVLLCFALSSIFSTVLKHLPQTITHARTLLYAQLQRIYPLVAEIAGVGGRSSINNPNGIITSSSDDPNLYMSWSSFLISMTSITTSQDPKSHSFSSSIDTLSNTNQSFTRERTISPGEDLIQTLLPFLTSDQSSFREATVRALSSIHVSMYPTLLEGLSRLAHHLTSERKMIEAQKDRLARPNGAMKITRLFSAIGKLHESTTRLLFHPEFNLDERMVEVLVRFSRETCLFVRSRQTMDDYLTISIRKSLLVFGERLLRKLGANLEPDLKLKVNQLCPNDLLIDMFNLAEDWSLRTFGSLNNNSVQAGSSSPRPAGGLPSRASSLSNRSNIISTSNGSDLIIASATMIATLCENILDVRVGNGSQRRIECETDRPTVTINRILRWSVALFEKNISKAHAQVRRAFIGSVKNSSESDRILEAALAMCWNESDTLPVQQTLFGVLSSTLMTQPTLKIRQEALLALCLARLTHRDLALRQRVIDLLKSYGLLNTPLDFLDDVEVRLGSTFSGHHLDAQFQTSMAICNNRMVDPADFIIELGMRIMQIDSQKSKQLSRLMPTWLTQIQLPESLPNNNSSLKIRTLLNILVVIALKILEIAPDEVRPIWSSFANASTYNSMTIVNYFVEQTARRGSPEFVKLARTLLSCMSDGNGVETIIKDLLRIVEPAKLSATLDVTSCAESNSDPRQFEIDSYFPLLSSRTILSPMQAAILLLGETMVLRPLLFGDRLAHVLHAYMIQADHTNTFFRDQMRDGLVRFMEMLTRIQRSEHPGPINSKGLQTALTLSESDCESWRSFWEFDDLGSSRRHRKGPPSNMVPLIEQIVHLSSKLLPDFGQNWAKVTIEWATQCPVRHAACRSLQVFGAIASSVNPTLLGELLVRLSSTASDPSPDIRLFALEVLTTYSIYAKLQPVNNAILAQLFWIGVSCLETSNDLEFLESIDLLKAILNSIEGNTCLEIATSRPKSWEFDSGPIRALVVKGLRSSQTCQATWSLIKSLLSVPDHFRIIDWINGGLAFLYVACLPWCLQILETGVMQYEMDEIALKLGELASSMGMDGLSRVMISFSKNRFRTKEDFLRQAVNGIREYFLPKFGSEILIVYLGLLCNPLEWLRVKTLVVLKLFVRMIEPSSAEMMELGYDLLTPLLNLLHTNVSHLALDILAEPLPTKSRAGNGKKNNFTEEGLLKNVFGTPDETGWCVPNPQDTMKLTRSKLTDVANTFTMSFISENLTRPIPVEFTHEWNHEVDQSLDVQTQSDFAETNESFGDMVSTLHDLSDFFGQDSSNSSSQISSPLNPSSARVAAILSRSLSKRRANRPSLHVKSINGIYQVESSSNGANNKFISSSSSPNVSRPQSMVSFSSSSSPLQPQTLKDQDQHQGSFKKSFSADSGDDEDEDEEISEEEIEGNGKNSSNENLDTDEDEDNQSSVFDLDDLDNYNKDEFDQSKMMDPLKLRRKSRQVGMDVQV